MQISVDKFFSLIYTVFITIFHVFLFKSVCLTLYMEVLSIYDCWRFEVLNGDI